MHNTTVRNHASFLTLQASGRPEPPIQRPWIYVYITSSLVLLRYFACRLGLLWDLHAAVGINALYSISAAAAAALSELKCQQHFAGASWPHVMPGQHGHSTRAAGEAHGLCRIMVTSDCQLRSHRVKKCEFMADGTLYLL